MRAYIEAAPLPCEGSPPYSRPEWRVPEEPGDRMSAAYGWSARSLARGVLALYSDDLSLLTDDSLEFDAVREAFRKRWPKGFEWSGASLFQWGWAISAARQSLGVGPAHNPAVLVVRSS